jgi:ABC-type multidrug transport system ATPase subunit
MIADRKLNGFWSGDIYVDGRPRTDNFRLRTAYVLQDDLHIATLTVEETIYYSAWTRVPSLKTHEQIQERVDSLLKMMGIEHVKNSIVGDALRKGISGGQMKRLSIAVELVCLPDVIFLDEPTSGLDSSISLEVMGAVKDLIGAHRLCVSTIHQPSPEVFALFDKLVVLSAGRLIYSADTKDCVAYFTNPHMGYTYTEGENPAEFVIAVGGGKELPKGYAKIRQPDELEMMFKSSKYFYVTSVAGMKSKAIEAIDAKPETATLRVQFRMLMARSWLAKARDYTELKAQLFKNIVVGVLIGIVFYGQGNVSEPFYTNGIQSAEVSSVNSILFFTMMFTMVGNLQTIPYLCSQILVYRRELASNAYVTFPYWFSQLFCTLPIQFAYHFLFVIVLYFLVQLPATANYFFYYLGLTFFMNLVAFYSSLWLAAATNSEALAFALFPITFLFVTNFSGYAISINSLPSFWAWGAYVSYGRWGFEGLMVNEWDRYSTDDITDDANKDGNGDLLDVYGFSGFDKGNAFWILLLYMMGFSAFAYYALLPPVKTLEKVAPGDMTLSAGASIVATRRSKSLMPWGDTVTDWMKESLIGDDLKADKNEDQDNMEYVPRKTTEFYRVSTGVMPVAKGCHVSFKNIDYTVTDKLDSSKKSQLLTKVTGQVFPGEMCALMGASGAGNSRGQPLYWSSID